MAKKINIELTPYNATVLVAFFRKYYDIKTTDGYECKALQEAISEFEQDYFAKITPEQYEDATHEHEVNKLIGK